MQKQQQQQLCRGFNHVSVVLRLKFLVVLYGTTAVDSQLRTRKYLWPNGCHSGDILGELITSLLVLTWLLWWWCNSVMIVLVTRRQPSVITDCTIYWIQSINSGHERISIYISFCRPEYLLEENLCPVDTLATDNWICITQQSVMHCAVCVCSRHRRPWQIELVPCVRWMHDMEFLHQSLDRYVMMERSVGVFVTSNIHFPGLLDLRAVGTCIGCLSYRILSYRSVRKQTITFLLNMSSERGGEEGGGKVGIHLANWKIV